MSRGGKHTEGSFEAAIEVGLLERGFAKGDPSTFDAQRGFCPSDVLAWVRASQPKRWAALEGHQGERAAETLLSALAKERDLKGTLHVLRHGFKCFGRKFNLATYRPATTLNPESLEQYALNRLTITRQVRFNPDTAQSIDVFIALNGIPVATAELKNPMTGQTVEHAKTQYMDDRDPRLPLFRFKTGALVHFAVDPDWVFMATKLDGRQTFWLPFNRGHNLGKGNPPSDDGRHKTAYLWEEVLARDSLMDIVLRFIHLEVKERQVHTTRGIVTKRKETMIFPRYHQLAAVRKLVGHAQDYGSGRNYLVQHSAGSGKSNSIAWLAHHLSSLHDAEDNKIFDSVVVVTDRRVLDQQLQETVHQFEQTRGVVQKIDEDTQQLARALSDGTPIIISTIQKFPFIARALGTLEKKGEALQLDTAGKRFAVIVDEAHSSSAGETAQALRGILNSEGIAAAVAEQILDDGDDDSALSDEAKEAMMREMAARPRQPNLSYFAFTATPKFKTKALFNEPGDDGHAPFHLYSMRQAIQEGFIMDVLANYTTYKAFFGLLKAVEDDPEVPKREAAKALGKFLSLHPTNIGQKVQVIIEHFRRNTRAKIGGRAKAMVVTGSRLHAVRYKLEMDRYIRQQGYTDLRTLVAFSGEVIDPDDVTETKHTEVRMNGGMSEKALPEQFGGDDYQVLIVAEKYQTGFDQPLLHTMYVDKRLAGVQAVQTLSRLNRRADGKSDTFVLDFVNERDEIFNAFKPYFGVTEIGDMPEPEDLNRLAHELEQSPVIERSEVLAFCEIWFRKRRKSTEREHGQLNAIVDQACERFRALGDEEKDAFRGRLASFRNLYAFLSQVIPYQDSDLEMLYTYGRQLLSKLPRDESKTPWQLDDEVALQYYRLQQIEEGRIDLEPGDSDPLKGPTEVGSAGFSEEPQVPLSSLIDILNERFGTDWTQADQLFIDQVVESAVSDERIQTAARANTRENFGPVIERVIDGLFIDRLDGNEAIVDRVMPAGELRKMVVDYITNQVYGRLRGH